MKTRISAILKEKSSEIISVAPESIISEAIQKMAKKKVGTVLVLEADRIVGIFSERDYMNKIILGEYSAEETMVKEIMTTKVPWVTPDSLVEEGMAVMTEKKCHYLPVLDDKKLVGIVSMGDLVKRLSQDQKVELKSLNEYIELRY